MSDATLIKLFSSMVGVLIAVVTFLGKRMLKQFDDALVLREAADVKSAAQITSLTNALNAQIAESSKLRTALASLLKSFGAFDKWIYGELQHGTFKTKPPTFDHTGDIPTPEAVPVVAA
jgi:hypothetical protein